MLILAMEAGLQMPEVLFQVAEDLKHEKVELRERFAISSEEEEARNQTIGFQSTEDCIFW